MNNLDFFNHLNVSKNEAATPYKSAIGQDSYLLHHFATAYQEKLLPALKSVITAAPFRHMVTRGGFKMSVGMTNCSHYGWVSDRKGYRYSPLDPLTEAPWPKMPEVFYELAHHAAYTAGFAHFNPDACLINRYEIGAKMALHQDQDEQDFSQPIVSVSLGIPATFLFGGLTRIDKTQRVLLEHGDVLVWGGVDRLRFHGVLPIKKSHHPILLDNRINLTFRRAF